MKIDQIFTFLQQDFLSLNCILQERDFCIDDIKRRLFLLQRNKNFYIPNNYFKLNNEKYLNKINSFSDLFLVFKDFATSFFIHKENNIYIEEQKFIEWQNIISFVSLLLLVSAYIENSFNLISFTPSEIRKYFHNYIVPNTRNTSLLSPDCIPLKNFFKENGGFYDLHIHINGITEPDAVWQNLLSDTDRNIEEVNKSFNIKDGLKDLIEQNGLDINTDSLRFLLETAKKLRSQIFDIIFSKNYKCHKNSAEFYLSPFTLFFENQPDTDIPAKLLRYEALMYVCIFKFIEQNTEKSEEVSKLFYKYLLINGLFLKTLAHDKYQFGFQQFQEITKTNLREQCDKKALSKFFQLCGNNEDLSFFKFAEFRFSPKDSVTENKGYVRQLCESWKLYKKENLKCDFSLIAHFIKEPPKNNNNDVFYELRKKLDKRTEALVSFLASKNELSKKIVAIDAASSEFDTPPEVFAPYFRRLREVGISHFTYHAGEDFYHVLSGLRAIYETVKFCDLRQSDRIGHATAAGINIADWYKTIKDGFCISKSEWMDNLVFTVSFIENRQIKELYEVIPLLIFKIEKMFSEIYGESLNFAQIEKLWNLRAEKLNSDKIKKSGLEKFIEKYYSSEYLKKKNEEILYMTDIEYLSVENLNILQKEILKYLHEKEIIIETLPTSNFRIGFYDSFSSYQLFNWFDLFEKDEPLPPILIGTDDPGIFSTNIFNEYALIYCYLVYEKNKNRNKVLEFIKILNQNAKIYAFYKN